MSRNLGALTLLDPSGPAWPVMGVLYPVLHIYIYVYAHASKDKGTSAQAIKGYGGVDYRIMEAQLHLFSTLEIYGCKWQLHVPAAVPQETALCRHK
jgi:hypothetical protein